MMFSKTCEYAIRALVYISSATGDDKKAGIAEICDGIGAPRHFTAKILQTLSKEGIVSSQKGVRGGFYINAIQAQIPLMKIVAAMDGPGLFEGCGLGLKYCSETNPCPLHDKFKSIRADLKAVMESTTIGEMALKVREGSGVLKAI